MSDLNQPHHDVAIGRSNEDRLASLLTGRAHSAIKSFCRHLPDLPRTSYPAALLGMGYFCEFFDLMFAVIACNVQATQDESDYEARYLTVQNVLRPFSSEYGIEPGRPLLKTHRELFRKFYEVAAGEAWPSRYPATPDNPWLERGRYWAKRMLANIQRHDLGSSDKAIYNLGYHWAVEYVSVGEFDELSTSWLKLGVKAAWLNAHREVEPEHADCATAAIAAFTALDDPLVARGIRDHEEDLAGFYTDFVELIERERAAALCGA